MSFGSPGWRRDSSTEAEASTQAICSDASGFQFRFPGLEAALADSTAAGLPQINVAPNQGKLLELIAKIRGARRILEIGTLGGYSTIWLARSLPTDGRLISLERWLTYGLVRPRKPCAP